MRHYNYNKLHTCETTDYILFEAFKHWKYNPFTLYKTREVILFLILMHIYNKSMIYDSNILGLDFPARNMQKICQEVNTLLRISFVHRMLSI